MAKFSHAEVVTYQLLLQTHCFSNN